jgi:PAS domain S-box-containing protein
MTESGDVATPPANPNTGALRESEYLNRAVLEAVPDLMFILSKEGYHLDFKAARREDLAVPPEKIIGSHIDDTGFTPDKLAEFKRAIALAIKSGGIHTIHYDLTTPKGPGHWEARVVRLDESRALTIVRDVTEQRKAERALADSEALLQSVLEKMPVGIWLTEKTGKITYGNPEARRIWGGAKYVGPEQFDQYLAWWVADGKRIEPHEWAASRAIREGLSFINQEIEIQAFDGVKRTILNSAIPFRDDRGAIQGCFIVNQDITSRRQEEVQRSRLESQILQAQKLESLGVLAGGIAHDFNNLLVGILGNADLALMEVGTSSSARHFLEDLKRAAIRASELTNQMLAYSGKGRFVIEAVNINDLVHEMSHLLKVSISKRAVVKYHFFEQLPAVEADPTQIRQVVMNLITNASDAIGNKSGIISLSTGVVDADEEFFAACQVHENPKPGYYVFVEVSDTGIGMDAETIARIFEPFFTTKFTGRGLGLAAVMGIARGHRGAVRVESHPGKGSTFTVYFPCQEALLHNKLRAEKGSGHTQRGEGLVLVVDDEESVRNIAKIMLERHGFSVITAKDGRDAVKVFQKRAPELAAVVLDMTMPHMGGEETFQKMLEIRPDIQVVLASGYTEQEATAHFVGKGLAGFIQKPFQLAHFVQKICDVTAR